MGCTISGRGQAGFQGIRASEMINIRDRKCSVRYSQLRSSRCHLRKSMKRHLTICLRNAREQWWVGKSEELKKSTTIISGCTRFADRLGVLFRELWRFRGSLRPRLFDVRRSISNEHFRYIFHLRLHVKYC